MDNMSLIHSDNTVWDCGIDVNSRISGLIKVPRCSEPREFLVPFKLRKEEVFGSYGVGIKISSKSLFKFLVVEVQYAHARYSAEWCSLFILLTIATYFLSSHSKSGIGVANVNIQQSLPAEKCWNAVIWIVTWKIYSSSFDGLR